MEITLLFSRTRDVLNNFSNSILWLVAATCALPIILCVQEDLIFCLVLYHPHKELLGKARNLSDVSHLTAMIAAANSVDPDILVTSANNFLYYTSKYCCFPSLHERLDLMQCLCSTVKLVTFKEHSTAPKSKDFSTYT